MLNYLLKPLGLLHWFYPVRQFLRARGADYFMNYHLKEILLNAEKSYSISKHYKLSDLLKSPSFRGLMKELFRIGDFYQNPKNVSVAINVAFGLYGSEGKRFHTELINFSYHLCSEVKERIIGDLFLKNLLEEYGKDVEAMKVYYDRALILKVFDTKKDLFTEYFQTFNNPNYDFPIKIWHQSEGESWIKWEEKDSLMINVDKLRIREGFFLTGFDYTIVKNHERLQMATRIKGYEYYNQVEKNDEVIWAR